MDVTQGGWGCDRRLYWEREEASQDVTFGSSLVEGALGTHREETARAKSPEVRPSLARA